jgi:hypothetical protein
MLGDNAVEAVNSARPMRAVRRHMAEISFFALDPIRWVLGLGVALRVRTGHKYRTH